MSPSKTVVLSLAAVLLSAVSVQAASPVKHAAHKASHSMSHKTKAPATPSADNSADMLNAQSLTRAQGAK